ncbi:MAG: hypothetical protein H6Q73_4167 [Firmicutes bacterium]|nr:hypothetical protein [Bacillota bacterium]
MKNNLTRPTILVDLKKCRIRIHKNTLHSIGNPDNVLLLVNPEEHTLAILCSDRSDPRAHHISWASLAKRKSFELYSSVLVKSLRNVCNDWQDNQSYRIYGEIISNEGVALFHMTESVLVNRAQS